MEFLIPALLAVVIVVFVSRELWCWYFRINEAIRLLQEIDYSLRCLPAVDEMRKRLESNKKHAA